jgi:hypothetical protein
MEKKMENKIEKIMELADALGVCYFLARTERERGVFGDDYLEKEYKKARRAMVRELKKLLKARGNS